MIPCDFKKLSSDKRVVEEFIYLFIFHLFLLVGGWLLYNIVVVFAIHWHESAMDLHVFPISIPPPASLPTPSLWVFPLHQPWAPVSCIQPGLVICFTLDRILVSMLFSQNTPPSPTPTESKSLFYTSVSLFLFCIWSYHYHLLKFDKWVIILYWSLSFWLTSLCIMGSSFIHLIRTDSNEIFLMAE